MTGSAGTAAERRGAAAMSMSGDIMRSWRAPGRVVAEMLAAGAREDRALAHLLIACGLLFVAQWPRLARAAAEDPSVPFEARLGGALMATLFMLPLILYGIAAASHLVLRAIHAVGRAFGGRGRFEDALILVVWLHAVGFVLQLAQLAILLILPPLAQLVVLAGIALLFWLLTGFVAELHGFVSRVQVFVMILVTLLALSFALALVLGMLGIAPPEV